MREDEAQVVVFDDAGQTDDPLEKESLDVHALNRLAKDDRKQLDAELPQPKMDALVKTLAERWTSGRKAVVFVRRIGSVKELKAKLEVEYDAWLKARLQRRLPSDAMAALERWREKYRFSARGKGATRARQKRATRRRRGARRVRGDEGGTAPRGGRRRLRGTGPRRGGIGCSRRGEGESSVIRAEGA